MIFQTAVGVFLLIEGWLCIQEHPSTDPLRGAVRRVLATVLGDDYRLPATTVGVVLALLGLFALFNAFMMLGARSAFWVI